MSNLTLTKSPVSTIAATATLGAWIAAVKAAGAGIGSRPPVPVLTGCRIDVAAGVVTVSGFDYENAATAVVSGGSGTDGSVLVSHKLLLDMLTTAGKRATKRISDAWIASVALESDGKVKVSINGTAFTLAPLPIDEFPTLPTFESDTFVTLDPALFIRRMDSAMVAVSTDDTLPILTGIKMEIQGKELALLTTDRYRLTLAEMPLDRPNGEHDYMGEYSVLFRAKTWKQFKKHISPKGGPLTMRFHEASAWGTGGYGYRVSFHQGDVSLGALTVDGDYPKVRSLFPESAPIVFEMDADALASAVAQVAVTAERNTPVRFTYNGIDSLRVDAGTGEDATAQAFLPYTSPMGNRGFSVAFNPKYLGDVLKDLKGKTVQMRHTDAPKPALVVAHDSLDVQHLIMPVRLPR